MSTSYSNPHGSDDRRSMIIISSQNITINGTPSAMFDGDTTSDNRWWLSGVSLGSTVWIKWDFLVPLVIDGIKFYEQSATSQGTWKLQGSNDDSSYTDVNGGTSFAFGATATTTVSIPNTTAYRYYRIVGVSGSTNSSPWCRQFEFSCSDTSDLRTDLTAIPATATQVRVIINNIAGNHGCSDVISFQVNAVEQVTNGSAESGSTGWTTWYGLAPNPHTYVSEGITAPGGAGSNLWRGNGAGAIYQVVSLSGLNLALQIDISAYTGGETTSGDQETVAFIFENVSGAPLDGVVCRPYTPAQRSNASAVTLRSLRIAATASSIDLDMWEPRLSPVFTARKSTPHIYSLDFAVFPSSTFSVPVVISWLPEMRLPVGPRTSTVHLASPSLFNTWQITQDDLIAKQMRWLSQMQLPVSLRRSTVHLSAPSLFTNWQVIQQDIVAKQLLWLGHQPLPISKRPPFNASLYQNAVVFPQSFIATLFGTTDAQFLGTLMPRAQASSNMPIAYVYEVLRPGASPIIFATPTPLSGSSVTPPR